MLATGLGVEVVLAQESVDGGQGGELRVLLAPAAVEDFNGDGEVGLGLFEDPAGLFGGQDSGLAFVGTGLGHQRGEAALLMGVVPVFDGAPRVEALGAVGAGHRATRHLFQGCGQRDSLVQTVLDLGDEGITL